MSERYTLVASRASAASFHARPIPQPAPREIWVHEVTAPALVLGSTQRDDVVDHDRCRARGIEVVRRRSGGGAVLLTPGRVTWIDVLVPRGSAGWADDVHAPMRWLGERLADTFAELVDASVTAHVGGLLETPWSRTVCFDGVGAGEVLLDGAKLVGISQRRTRDAARLQCCWYSAYDPAELVELLAPAHRPPLAELAPVATVAANVAAGVPARLLARLGA